MKTTHRLCALLLIASFTLSAGPPTASAAGPASITSSDDLDRALAEHLAGERRSREALGSLLRRPEVTAVAESLGLDLRRAETAVSSLEGAELTALAEQARRADSAVAGGAGGPFSSWSSVVLLVLLVGLLVLVIAEPL